MGLQNVLLIYDIPNDRARMKVADACLDYGLDRIQYSAFYGQLSRTHQEELMLRVKKHIRTGAASIQLIPVAAREWGARIEIIQEELDA